MFDQRVINWEIVPVSIDESHFHRDLEAGFARGPIGNRIWRASDCPPLSERTNWYETWNFSGGEYLIRAGGACNTVNT